MQWTSFEKLVWESPFQVRGAANITRDWAADLRRSYSFIPNVGP